MLGKSLASGMSQNLFGKIGNLLFGEEPAAKRPTAGQRAHTPHGPQSPAALPNLPERLPAGTMQLIGLAGVQQVLGERWAERSENILRLVEGVLRRKLDVTDAFYKVDEENYLILFTRLGRREAEFKAKVISDEIQKLVVGEVPADHEVIVTSNVAEVDRGFVLGKIHSLKELVQYVRETPSDTDEEGITFFHGGRAADPEVRASDDLSLPAVVGEGPDLADLDQSLANLFQKKTTAAFLKECRAGFYPLFSVKRRSFSSYHSTVIHVPSGRPAHGISDPFLENPDELPFQLDRYVLTAGLLGVHRMLTSGRRGIVVMPVTYDTLAQSKLRDVYFTRLKEVPTGVVRFLGISVRNIPPGTPASRIAEVMAYVQPFCASRFLRIPPDPRLIDLYAGTGCHGFSSWVPQEEDTARRCHVLSNFTRRAALHRMECVLTDAGSHDDLSTALAAGFTYMSGDAVAGMIEMPGFIDGLSADHILKRIGSAGSGHSPMAP